MENIRAGIIGIGNMGTAHAHTIYGGQIAGMTLSAVCDVKEERRAYCKENFPGAAVFADAEEMIASGLIDMIIIAVPHKLHTYYAEKGLLAGLHVLTEKPADVLASKARSLHELAKSSGKVFGIMFNQRTNPLFAKAREIVQGGQLGELKRSVWIITNWYRTQSYYDSGDWRATWSGEGGGVLLNQAPHNLDLWQWICGMPQSVIAFCDMAKYHHIEVEDDVTIYVRYQNGATGAFITTTGECPGTNRLEVSGDLGKLVLEDGVLKWWKLKTPEPEFRFTCPEGFAQIPYDYEEITMEKPEEAHPGILRDFVKAVNEHTPLLAPGYDGVYELSISNAAYLSEWENHRPVTLPMTKEDEERFEKLLSAHAESSVGAHAAGAGEEHREYSSRWQVRW